MSTSRELDRSISSKDTVTLHSSASDMVSLLGSVFGGSSPRSKTSETNSLVVGDVERAVKESRKNYEKVVLAQETVNGVKMDGIDTNLPVMKELMFPIMKTIL